MNLEQKLYGSLSRYLNTLLERGYSPYYAKNAIENVQKDLRHIAIILYNKDNPFPESEAVKDIANLFDSFHPMIERKKEFTVLSFTDLFLTKETVKIFLINKSSADRDEKKILKWNQLLHNQ